MRRLNRYLRVELLPGIFRNEYTAIARVGGREVSSVVPRDQVKVDQEPSEGRPGSGLLGVQVVRESPSEALIDLPTPAFTSEPRLTVSLGDLVNE
jgi:hypothetical protein